MNPRLATQVTWGGRSGGSLRALVGAARVRLDAGGVRAAFGELEVEGATCVAGARWAWSDEGEAREREGEARATERRGEASGRAGDACVGEARMTGRAEGSQEFVTGDGVASLRAALLRACADVPGGRGALALSGGVDSAVLAGLLGRRVVAYTLAPEFAGYGEVEEARAVAGRFGVELREVAVREADYVEGLPAAIRGCESALYNLHPVSRLLLARAARADGVEWMITGDGADEIFKKTRGADYLPIVGAMMRAAGLTAVAPFLAAGVAERVVGDPDKRALRALAGELGVPEGVAWRAKRPRLAPAMDLRGLVGGEEVAALGRCLGRAPGDATDRERVGWTTLALLTRCFPGMDLSCVGSPG